MFRMFLIFASIGMNRLMSQSSTPTTINVTIRETRSIATPFFYYCLILGPGETKGLSGHCPVRGRELVKSGAFYQDFAKGVGANALHLKRLRLHGPAKEDRKSTRLNSSHPSISYAVFCLKKKK